MGRRIHSVKRQLFRGLLRETRLNAGLTQAALSAKLGRVQSYISDVENGKRKIDWVDADEISAACGIEIVTLAKTYVSRSR